MTPDMLHIISTIKGAVVMTGIAAAATGTGMLADVVSNDTPITLGSAISVGAVVVVGAWYLSSRLQKIDDRLKSIELNCGKCGTIKPDKNQNL